MGKLHYWCACKHDLECWYRLMDDQFKWYALEEYATYKSLGGKKTIKALEDLKAEE